MEPAKGSVRSHAQPGGDALLPRPDWKRCIVCVVSDAGFGLVEPRYADARVEASCGLNTSLRLSAVYCSLRDSDLVGRFHVGG